MNYNRKRKALLRQFAQLARQADRTGDTPGRIRWAQQWREIASDAEAQRAPRYLTWLGRDN